MFSARERYTCPVTGKTADLPHGSTCHPKHVLGCPPEDLYLECQSCDLAHHYEIILPARLKAEREAAEGKEA